MKKHNLILISAALLLLMLILILTGVFKDKGRSVGSQDLVVYHAGSLSVPMKNLADAFSRENSGVVFRMEAAGSIHCIRKITDLNQPCDVLAVADFSLVDELMIPQHASWNLLFATNELCLAYTGNSSGQDTINQDNWYKILKDKSIAYGRSDPDADPCGYRTILALQLAEKLYPGGVGAVIILAKDNRFIRSKETDLNALLETRTVDYIFTYRSVAVQHGFKYLVLPDSIHLGNPELADWYAQATVTIPGTHPGERIEKQGAPMYYGITIPKKPINPDLALRFVRFVIDPEKGGQIIRDSGQNPIAPAFSAASEPPQGIF